MAEKKDGQFVNIDIGDLFNTGDTRSIRNFYLSEDSFGGRFPEEGTSFMFNGFSIILCRCGTCSVRISGRDYEAVPGSLLILSPDQLVEVFSVSPDFSHRSILVSLDVILEFPSPVDINIVNTALRNPLYSLPPEKTAHLLEYYDFLEKQYRETDNAYREEISKTLFYALMLEICDIIRSDTGDSTAVSKPRQEKLTDDFFKLMARYYKTEHNVAFYADRLNRTPKYLSGAIKKLSGRSVSDWINSSLISEIKLLLKVTDKTVLEISEELNFSSPSFFVQFFRHHTGTTPLQYRKQG